ncbi:MAG: hypothetical protein KatS3mg031_0271 [Chitinophagales bacterium]|nr:MAG: hypothetical protein KatS3mg031_0271 [Chitinophagales bacterium]
MRYIYLQWVFFIVLPIYVFPQVSGDTSVCSGDVKTYHVPYLSGAGYNWSITGGTALNAVNTDSLVIQWGPAGTGTIIVNQYNPSTFHTLNVSIHPKPKPSISHAPYPTCPPEPKGPQGGHPDRDDACEVVCKNAVITYTTPYHAGSTYQWVVSGASSVIGINTNTVTITWDASPLGNIIVYETNQWGCTDSFELCIEKADLPVANFSHQTNLCKFSPVLFTNLTTGATSYQWYFGDGDSSNQFSPTHAYATAGTYTVTLIATNACYCRDTFQSVIHVDSLPGPEISCPSTVCAFDTATYSTAAVSGCTYNWFVSGGTILAGQGTPNVTVAWGAGQQGVLGLQVSGCGNICSDTTLVYIPIVPVTASINGPIKVCPGECTTYNLPQFSGATYSWSLSGACGVISDTTSCEEVKICWTSPPYLACNDTLQVAFYDSFLNCGGTGSLIIHVRPELSIVGSSQVCSNYNGYFGTLGNITCNWSISPAGPTLSSGPAPSVTVNWNGLTGTFTLMAVPVNPNQVCTDTSYYVVKVLPPPPAPVITGDTIICPGSTVSYCAVGSGQINWLVTGGTPATVTGNCISVTWGNSGPYQLKAFQQLNTAPYCTSDTTVQNVYAFNASPPLIMGSSVACANTTSNYTCMTTYPPGTTYTWSITPSNAGAILSQSGPSTLIEWGNNAPQTVTLTLSVEVCDSTFQNSVSINLMPVPAVSVNQLSNLCAGGSAQLQALGGSFTTFSWSGPGGYTSSSNPTVIFQDGLYLVTVSDANGCTASSQKNVFYVSSPNASISSADLLTYCTGVPINTQMCALGNSNYQYLWSNGATTQCVTTNAPGSFTVTVTDASNGCTAVSNTLIVTQDTCSGTGTGSCQPNGSIGFTHTQCNPISFTNTSVNGSSFVWNFGDQTSSTAVNPVHTYQQAGFYLVSLTGSFPNLSGTGSCLLVDTAHIEIPLAAKFDFVNGCHGDSVCFTDKSTYTAGNNITSWNWNFGDANTSSLQNPCHVYAAPGTYVVSLTISNGVCSDVFTDTVVILPPPSAAFTVANTSCVNVPLLFNDGSAPNVNYWSWNFGDGGTSLNQNPSHSYNPAGSYTASLTVQDIYGCTDTTQQNINVVYPAISGNITALPDTVVCAGTPVVLIAPSCIGCTYQWNTGSTNDSITVTTTGVYTVTVTDANGCPYATYIHITVQNGPQPSITNYGSQQLCLGEGTSLSTTYNTNYVYYWISNDPVNNGSQSPGIYVSPTAPGVYNYQLIITDTTTNCSDTSMIHVITVNPLPAAPAVSALGSSVVCQGDTVILVASHPDSTVTLQWSTGQVHDTLIVTQNGCYIAQVTDVYGCKSDSTYCVTVNPLPELCAFYTGCADTCSPFTIQGPGGGISYQWLYNGNPLPGDTLQNYTATQNGNYAVVVTNSFGCSDTTGQLQLSLHNCATDSFCADLTIDSVYCDSVGNYVLLYSVSNNSAVDITQVTLQVLPPHLNTLYAPNLVQTLIPAGATSQQLSTTIYNGTAEDSLCFTVHLSAMDSSGQESVCCYSDTVCTVLPPCPQDSACCAFGLVHDSLRCQQVPTGNKFLIDLEIVGCGELTIQTGNPGIIGLNNPYILGPGSNQITVSYIQSHAFDTLLCLTFVVGNGTTYCADTSVCYTLKCPPTIPVCKLQFKDSICTGESTSFAYSGSTSGNTFQWQFTNGIPATATGPGPHTVQYATAGCHPVICIISNSSGQVVDCVDSICVFDKPAASISQNGNMLLAHPGGMSYQWYGPGFNLLNGEINQFFTPSFAEVFCVVVANAAGCKDTACIDYIQTGVRLLDNQHWGIYPNPNNGSFVLSLRLAAGTTAEVVITNVLGIELDRRVFSLHYDQQDFLITNTRLIPGIYFIRLNTPEGSGFRRVMVR